MDFASVVTALLGLSLIDLLLICLAAVVAGTARGFSGFGGALIFVPLASAIIGPKVATPLLLVIDGLMTLGMIPAAWHRANRREVFTMAAGALVGVPAGVAVLTLTPSIGVRWMICGIVVVLLAFLISGWRYHGTPKAWLTVAVGGLAGLFGGAAQLSGPPVVAYWLGGAFPAQTVRANLVLYFAVSTVISAIALIAAGLLSVQVLLIALAAGPAYGLGIFLGSRLFGFAPESTFRWICFALIGCAAVISLPLLDAIRP